MARKRYLDNGGHPDDPIFVGGATKLKKNYDYNLEHFADKYAITAPGPWHDYGIHNPSVSQKNHWNELVKMKSNVANRPNYEILNPMHIAELAPIVGDAIDIGYSINDIQNGNIGIGIAGLGLAALPNVIERPLKGAIQKTRKSIKRLTQSPSLTSVYQTLDGEFYSPSNIATNAYKHIPDYIWKIDYNNPDIREKYKKYKREALNANSTMAANLADSYLHGSARNLTNDEYRLLEDIGQLSPEYIQFIKENPTLHPLKQETLDAFFKRQGKSVRGIHVDNIKKFNEDDYLPWDEPIDKPSYDINYSKNEAKNIAKINLTTAPIVPKGGDRLGNKGLYTSNSREIADKFMRSEESNDALKRSYQGTIKYNFNIDKKQQIKEQLRQYRNKIYNYDWDSFNPDAEMIEAAYTRSNGNISQVVYERSIDPDKTNNVKLISLKNAGRNLPNLKGRWGLNDIPADKDLYIPKQPSMDSKEFIKFARRTIEDSGDFVPNEQKQKLYKEAKAIGRNRLKKREELVNNLIDIQDKRRKFNKVAIPTIGFGGLTLATITAGNIVKNKKDKQKH